MTDAPDSQGSQDSAPESAHEVAEYALLGLLREGPRHGYRLAAEFGANGRLGMILRLKMGQMYAYLRKLERQRLLVAHDEPGEMAGRTRRVFAWTPAGRRVFEAWLTEPVEATRDLRLAFLVKLAFTLDDPAASLALLERQRAATAAWLARLRARESEGGRDPKEPTRDLLRRLALRRRILQTEAALAWLDETRATVVSGGLGDAGGGAGDR